MNDDKAYQIALALYDQRLENDDYCIRQLFAPDATLEIVGTGTNGTVKMTRDNPNALREFIEKLASTWVWIDQEIHDVFSAGNRMAVRHTVTMEYTPLKRRVVMDVADFFTFENGLISHLAEFVDTAMVERLAKEAPKLPHLEPVRVSA